MRRILFLLGLLLTFADAAWANQAARGWCESGAQVVVLSGLQSTTQVQASYPSCSITVFVHGGGLATITSDNVGTPLANPFTAQTNGQWQFYAPNGHYDVTMSGGGLSSPVTYSDVYLNDMGSATGGIFGIYQAVSFASSITFNAAQANIFGVTLTGNNTSSVVTNPQQQGQVIVIDLCQDATGGRTFTFPANFIGSPTISTNPNVCTGTMWFYNGANWLLISGGGGGGGGGTPGGVAGQVQVNSPLGIFGGASCLLIPNLTTGPNFLNCDSSFSLNPYTDIRSLPGGRQINFTSPPAVPGINATTVSGNTSVTLSSASTFQNGDYVTIWNAGAASGLSTPNSPTVQPSGSGSLTGTGIVVNAPAGSTSFQYQCVAAKFAGGFTPAGTATSITNGQPLGWTTVNIANLAKSGITVTATTSSPHTLSAGYLVGIQNTTDTLDFGGWYIVQSVPDNTHFTYQTSSDSRGGGLTSATGGTAGWFNVNHVTCPTITGADFYVLYGRTAGSMGLVGVSKPSSTASSIIDPAIDDYGSPMMGTMNLAYFPSTPPVSGGNNHLTTSIVSGGGTTTLVLTAAPSVNATETILFDNGPAMASVASGSNLTIPAASSGSVGTVVNSYTVMPANTNIYQEGLLILGWTLQVGTNTRWYGQPAIPGICSILSFSNICNVGTSITYSIPGIYQPGSQPNFVLRGINLQGPNDAVHMVLDNSNAVEITDSSFHGTGGQEYMTEPIVMRGSFFESAFRNVTMVGSQTGNSTTPLLFCNRCSTLRLDWFNLSGRGVGFDGIGLHVMYGRKQGGTAPAFTVMPYDVSGGGVGGVSGVPFVYPTTLEDYELDTDPNPFVANLSPLTSDVRPTHLKITGGAPFPSQDSGGPLPVVSGYPFYSFSLETVANPTVLGITNSFRLESGPGQNSAYGLDIFGHPTYGTSPNQSQSIQGKNMDVVGGNGITIRVNAPTPTATVTTSGCGGTFPAAGSYTFQLAAVNADSTLSLPGFFSNSVTVNGTTQCVNVTWTDINNVLGYKVLARLGSGTPGEVGAGGCNNFSSLISGNSCVFNNSTVFTPASGLNGAGNPALYPGYFVGSKFIWGSLAGSYGTDTWTGSFTANRNKTIPDINGTFMVYQGSWISGHCAQATLTGALTAFVDSGGTCPPIPTLPTAPNGVPQVLCSTPSGGIGQNPLWCLQGVAIDKRTTTSETVSATDRGGFMSFSNASPVAVTLPQAGSGGGGNNDFTHNFVFVACNAGAGTVTVTPTTSTISYWNGTAFTSGAVSMPITTGQCSFIYSDNTNYSAILIQSGGGGSGTVNNCSTTGAMAYYAATGTTVSCNANIVLSAGGTLTTYGGVTVTDFGVPGVVGASHLLAQTATTGTVTFTSPASGFYWLHYYADQNAVAASGSCAVSYTFNWTDASNARQELTGNLPLLTTQQTSGWMSGTFPIFVGSGNVTFSTNFSGTCPSASYDSHVQLLRTK